MATIRVNKTKDYTIMSNYHLKEKNMSLKAKGLLSLMLSLPDDWNYSVAGLVAMCKENESAIKSTLNELREFGYLKITKLMPNESKSGRIEYIYDIYEFSKQEGKKQEIENQPLENQPLENQPQLNTNKLNTNKLNKENNKNNNILDSFNIHNEEDILNSSNILNELFLLKENQKKLEKENEELKKRAKTKSKEFVPPTLEEVKQYCLERNNKLDYKYFYDYFTEGNWKDSKGNQVKNWKQKIITWEKNKINKQEEHKQSQGIVYEQLN